MYKTSLNSETGTELRYLSVVPQSVVETEESNRNISDSSSLTDSDMEAALAALKTQMLMGFRYGNNFRLGDIGTFRLKIKADFDENGDVIRGSEKVNGIRFIASGTMLRAMSGYKLRCVGYDNRDANTYEARRAKFLDGYPAYEFITRYEYMTEMDVAKRTAVRDIMMLVKEGLLTRLKNGSVYVYKRVKA